MIPTGPEEDVVYSITDYMMEGMDMTFEPIYRVILHYSNWIDHGQTAKTIKQGVPVISYSHALRTAENAAAYGSAIVVTVPKDEAELYEQRLERLGFKVSLDIA